MRVPFCGLLKQRGRADRNSPRRGRFHGAGRAAAVPDRAWSADRASVSEWISGCDRSRPAVSSALAGRLQPLAGIGLRQPQDAQASAIAHLRMRLALQNGADDLAVAGPRFRPSGSGAKASIPDAPDGSWACARRRWCGGRRRVAARMRGDAFAAMEDLDGGGGVTGFQLLAGQLVRNAVIDAGRSRRDNRYWRGRSSIRPAHSARPATACSAGRSSWRTNWPARVPSPFAERPVIQLFEQVRQSPH